MADGPAGLFRVPREDELATLVPFTYAVSNGEEYTLPARVDWFAVIVPAAPIILAVNHPVSIAPFG